MDLSVSERVEEDAMVNMVREEKERAVLQGAFYLVLYPRGNVESGANNDTDRAEQSLESDRSEGTSVGIESIVTGSVPVTRPHLGRRMPRPVKACLEGCGRRSMRRM